MREGVLNVPADFVGLGVAKKHNRNNSNGLSETRVPDPPKEPHPLTLKLAIGVVSVGVAIILALVGALYSLLNQALTEHSKILDELRTTLSDQKVLTGRLEERITSLDKLNSGEYKSQAKAAGFTNDAQIIPVNLTSNASIHTTSDAPKVTASGTPNVQYTFTFSDLRYDQNSKTLKFRLSGKVGGNTIENNSVSIIIQPGESVSLQDNISILGMPPIFLHVIAVPVPNQAILAVGTKIDSQEKQS